MSAETLTVGMTGTSMGLDIYQGIMAKRAADVEAQSMRDQISLLRAEGEADVARYAEQAKGFKAEQKLKYLKSGVQLSGSPLDILDETVRVSSENISAMRAKTEAQASGIRSQAAGLQAKGRAALVAGVGKAFNTMASQYAKTAGAAEPKREPAKYDFGGREPSPANLGFGPRSRLNLI